MGTTDLPTLLAQGGVGVAVFALLTVLGFVLRWALSSLNASRDVLDNADDRYEDEVKRHAAIQAQLDAQREARRAAEDRVAELMREIRRLEAELWRPGGVP